MLRVVRLGSPRVPHEGTRIGTVRRPPRGVPKAQFATRDFYDVWLPELAPSAQLLRTLRAAQHDAGWHAFVRAYRAQMRQPEAQRWIAVLAALSHSGDFSVGCYCEDESRCHRSVLRELLAAQGAALEIT